MKLRDYQQDAVNAAIAHMKKSTEPSLLELATGAGKSLIVAAIAQWVHEFGFCLHQLLIPINLALVD